MKAEYVDHMGTDLTVVNSARVSFDKESNWGYHELLDSSGIPSDCRVLKESDSKLIRYLAKHSHFTPFTHCTVTLRETVPIFVARQRFKHTVGFSYNEVSRRYVSNDPTFYSPSHWRGKPTGNVKQGSDPNNLIPINPVWLRELYDLATEKYKKAIEKGAAPEQARMLLPQAMYTSYYVSGSLAAWARAYNLRAQEDAQWEIRQLADQWDTILEPLFPISWKELTYFG